MSLLAAEYCGTSFAALLAVPFLATLYFLTRGTHALLKALLLRAEVRSHETAFFIAFYLTPVALIALCFALNLLLTVRH